MKLSEKQMAFSHKVGIFLLWIYTHPGWTVTIGEVLRPQRLQNIYYKEGKNKDFILKAYQEASYRFESLQRWKIYYKQREVSSVGRILGEVFRWQMGRKIWN
ncbi:unnamed protein product [marine sediment metagenome]|uniref:Uncharacterized protein n=1 Tax=marine sediment metagenome TaxID=412755 RepID=X0ZE78_9ZZZZ